MHCNLVQQQATGCDQLKSLLQASLSCTAPSRPPTLRQSECRLVALCLHSVHLTTWEL